MDADAPMTRWQKIRLVIKVVELRLRFIALMAATGLVFAYWDTIWNYYDKYTRPAAERVAAASDTEFYCPMHPTVVRDEPGNCPICGMPLSKRTKGETEALPEGVTARVQLAPFRIKQAGIRTAAVDYAPLAETLTTVGYVTHDERRVAHIASKVRGKSRVERLFIDFLGKEVRQGEPLAELYSPELYQAEQELLIAARRAHADKARPQTALGRNLLGDADQMLTASVEKLKLWGITQAQVDEVLRTGKADLSVPILSPISGHVIKKNIVEGQYVEEGDPLFVVADLHEVWVRAKVYEDQIALLKVGQEVEAAVPTFPGRTFKGRVAFIFPHLDASTRTIEVRYDLANPGHLLRPGMFATVTLKTPVAETPAFQGKLASRARGDLTRTASLTVEQQQNCPVTGLKLGAMGDPVPIEVKGKHLWMCCPGCEDKLTTQPAKYLSRLAAPPSGEVLSVPESAVIDTGDRKVVYVEAEPGVFEGREVVLGPRSGDRYPVLEGLAPGDRVAAAGAFLIDAETRLNPAAGAAYFGASGQAAEPAKHSH